MKWRWIRALLALVGLLMLFLLLVGEILPLLIPFTLITGWAFSLIRLIKALNASIALTASFGMGLIILISGTHLFIRWLVRCLNNKTESASQFRWSWKQTLCVFGMAVCAFSATGAAMLTTHQIYWLSHSSEPWYVSSRQAFEVIRAGQALKKEADVVDWDAASTRAAFWRMQSRNGQPICESIQPIWIPKDGKVLRAVLLVPRKKVLGDRSRFLCIQPGSNDYRGQKMEKLPVVLGSFGVTLPTTQTKETVP
jgi:hypothetical protein